MTLHAPVVSGPPGGKAGRRFVRSEYADLRRWLRAERSGAGSLYEPFNPGHGPHGGRPASNPGSPGAVVAGGGSLVPFERLVQGLREARYALQLFRADGRLQAEFADLGTYQQPSSSATPGGNPRRRISTCTATPSAIACERSRSLRAGTCPRRRDRMEFFLALRARELLDSDGRIGDRKGPGGR